MTKPTKKLKPHDPTSPMSTKPAEPPQNVNSLSLLCETDGPAELHEFARLYYFKNGRDYPTPASYRRAIADIAESRSTSYADAEPYYGPPRSWLKLFRKRGSKPLPPRREGLLLRGRGETCRINYEEYAWLGHGEKYRSLIEQRARDYFKMAPEKPVHVNAWAASQRAYWREKWAEKETLRKKTEAATFYLVPKSRKKMPKGSPRRKLAPQFYCTGWGQTLKPHFNYEFPDIRKPSAKRSQP